MSNIFTQWFLDSSVEPVSNEAAVESAIELERALDDCYNLQTQLSKNNSTGICLINDLCRSYGFPALSDEQLRNVQYLLAGDAGERLVSQALNTVSGLYNIAFHDVILPFDYGRFSSNLDNQIDNLIITDTGIYCIEVKARDINNGVFDFRNLGSEIYQQIGYHKDAILKCLIDANINLSSQVIRTIVVIVDRNGRTNFKITYQDKLNGLGSIAVNLNELVLLLTNGQGSFYLNPNQMQEIANAIKNSRGNSKRNYPLNVCFNITKRDLGRIKQLSLSVTHHLPIEHVIAYNPVLNSHPLVGLNGHLQDMYWYIIGQFSLRGDHRITFSRKELKEIACLKKRNSTQFDEEVCALVKFMKFTEMFNKAEYNSGKMTIVIKERYFALLNSFSEDCCFWNYSLLKRIKYNYAKTLFRLLLERSKEGKYEVTIEEFRRLMAIPTSYKGVTDIIKKTLKELEPFFEGLTCNYSRGRANKITGVSFSFKAFNPEDLLWPF